MRIVAVQVSIFGQIHFFYPGDKKESVIEKLGKPEDTDGFSRKHRQPRIFKYENTEFHFDSGNRLILIYREREGMPEISIKFDEP